MRCKIIAMLMAILLTAGCFAACSKDDPSGDESDSDSAPLTEDSEKTEDSKVESGDDDKKDEDDKKEEEEKVIPKIHKITANTEGVKVLGVRNLASENGLHMDWSCSGAEFGIDLKEGPVRLNIKASAECYFRVWIDGDVYEQNGSKYFTVSKTIGTITLNGISAGKHTVRLMKVTGYTLAQAELTTITFAGDLVTDIDTADKDLYIEFIGDSITCGYSVLDKTSQSNGKYDAQDGTLAYSYLLADALDADYSMTALSGHRAIEHFIKKDANGDISKSMYLKTSPTKAPDADYGFERKADIVVINLGTNDYYQKYTAEQFEDYYYTLLKTVKKKNGEDCKILCLNGAMGDKYDDAILSAVERAGGKTESIVTYKLTPSGGHPTEEQHAAYAEELLPIIKSLPDRFVPTITIVPEGDGDSDIIHFEMK